MDYCLRAVIECVWFRPGSIAEKVLADSRQRRTIRFSTVCRMDIDTENLPLVEDLKSEFLADNKVSRAVDHHLKYYVWASGRDAPASDPEFAALKLHIENKGSVTRATARSIHNAAMKHLRVCGSRRTVETVFIPLFHSCWHPALQDRGMTEEREQALRLLLSKASGDESLLWCAFKIHSYGYFGETAEEAEWELLEKYPANPDLVGQMVKHLVREGRSNEAITILEHAAEAGCPDLALLATLGRLRKERGEREEFLRTAPERWSQVNYYQEHLMRLLVDAGPTDDFGGLAKQSGIHHVNVMEQLYRLKELGMVVAEDAGFAVNEHVLGLVAGGGHPANSIAAKVIRPDHTARAFKGLFASKLEYFIYKAVVCMFPNYLVIPNMSLNAIFKYDEMKAVLAAEDFKYYLNAQVDLCVVSVINNFPVIAFEVDSAFHDSPESLRRDERKNRVFALGGVPLVRLRPTGRATQEEVQARIGDALHELQDLMLETERKSNPFKDISLEMDFGKRPE